MTLTTLPVFHIARITIENQTPLSIVTGQADGVFDSALLTDANGLPTLSGTSIAGVLRHLYQREFDISEVQEVFGHQTGSEAAPSRLHTSWGYIHDESNYAIQGLKLGCEREALHSDSILNSALELANQPVTRDRVRISHKGTSVSTGKFDRAVLPAGYRFSFELSMWSNELEDVQWNRCLALLAHPLFRLGGNTRSGLGKLKLIQVKTQSFNLKQPEQRNAFAKLPRDINQTEGFNEYVITPWQSDKTIMGTLTLEPKSHWRIGQGSHATLTEDEKEADLLPKLELTISWENGKGLPAAEKLLIPASSVKGALSHRIAFHANRLQGIWAEDLESLESYDKAEKCESVRHLFGFSKDTERSQSGQVGAVLIDDAYRSFKPDDLQLLMHNSIDRFSGSVRDHMLFSEEMVWGKPIELSFTIDVSHITADDKKALKFALNDLCQGRLALGSGAAKGHGFFKVKQEIDWSDNGQWFEEDAV